ncbi:MAG: shikimate kinase [Gammaproteobacteria bacterium]
MNNNLFLIGPMGSGKTSIGRRLAKALKKTFYDLDHEIETQTGVKIPWIFDLEGEAGFRKREHETLKILVEKSNIVLSTGGGAILSSDNRELLKQHGTVIYLMTSPEQQYVRVYRDKNRPLVANAENPKEKLSGLLEQREKFYRNTADLTFKTDGKSVVDLVKTITQEFK